MTDIAGTYRTRLYRPLVAVLAAFVVSAFIVPTLAPVAISDDWIYARSVEILLSGGGLHILPTTVPTAVFQIVWGALFARLLGMTFGALRVSTVVVTLLGASALYGLCRELGVDRARSTLGAAVYLFSPLGYVLSFSFMTDPHLTALVVVATYFYVRGMRSDVGRERFLWLGSALAAMAFLVRQQGILVPLAVVTYLLFSHRVSVGIAGARELARVAAIPAGTAAIYYVWLYFVHGVPPQQTSFLGNVTGATGREWVFLVAFVAFIGAMYGGLFALPLAVGSLRAVPEFLRSRSTAGRRAFLIWLAFFVAMLWLCTSGGMRMPYVPHFLGRQGLGPNDLVVARPAFLSRAVSTALTALCALGAATLALALCMRLGEKASRASSAVGLTVAVASWQALGVLPPSFTFRGWTSEGLPAPSLDRYLLPLLPFAVCLLLWALRDMRLVLPLAWSVTAILAVYSIAGTRDSLVYQQATWALARRANAMGISNTHLDAGAAWDGYHLYEYSLQDHVPKRAGNGSPWWIAIWAPATDSQYVIACRPQPGFHVLVRSEYSCWLQRQAMPLYLMRQPGVSGPP